MRVSMEYLLCGLMVVTTPNRGGRDRYLLPPYAREVPPDPAAIASAVASLVANPIPKMVIRDYVARIVSFERHNLLLVVNRFLVQEFGTNASLTSISPLMTHANVWRPISQFLEPLTG